eukprot:GHVL01013881.1.p1 GENE.GHVL01013881.1~~GHVL01013881.1.p1  ORF type:complete len:621 (-),score=89.69 GHVL01013881.1:723-2585(-)
MIAQLSVDPVAVLSSAEQLLSKLSDNVKNSFQNEDHISNTVRNITNIVNALIHCLDLSPRPAIHKICVDLFDPSSRLINLLLSPKSNPMSLEWPPSSCPPRIQTALTMKESVMGLSQVVDLLSPSSVNIELSPLSWFLFVIVWIRSVTRCENVTDKSLDTLQGECDPFDQILFLWLKSYCPHNNAQTSNSMSIAVDSFGVDIFHLFTSLICEFWMAPFRCPTPPVFSKTPLNLEGTPKMISNLWDPTGVSQETYIHSASSCRMTVKRIRSLLIVFAHILSDPNISSSQSPEEIDKMMPEFVQMVMTLISDPAIPVELFIELLRLWSLITQPWKAQAVVTAMMIRTNETQGIENRFQPFFIDPALWSYNEAANYNGGYFPRPQPLRSTVFSTNRSSPTKSKRSIWSLVFSSDQSHLQSLWHHLSSLINLNTWGWYIDRYYFVYSFLADFLRHPKFSLIIEESQNAANNEVKYYSNLFLGVVLLAIEPFADSQFLNLIRASNQSWIPVEKCTIATVSCKVFGPAAQKLKDGSSPLVELSQSSKGRIPASPLITRSSTLHSSLHMPIQSLVRLINQLKRSKRNFLNKMIVSRTGLCNRCETVVKPSSQILYSVKCKLNHFGIR